MLSHISHTISKSDISLTKTDGKYYNNDFIVQKNTLIKMVSGQMRVTLPDAFLTLGAGETLFFPKNALARVIKQAWNGQPYQSVAIALNEESMQQYLLRHHIKTVAEPEFSGVRKVEKHPLLDSLFNSLLPYFDLENELPLELAEGKTDEAISILRSVNPEVFAAMATFSQPGKIDLAAFMEQNFMFNMSAEKFGFLTGRSLTTFKRDFKKAFGTSPQKWLTQRRLEHAHRQISQFGQKPAEVYFDAGFENLSHFSFAYKKRFGYAPTQTQGQPSA